MEEEVLLAGELELNAAYALRVLLVTSDEDAKVHHLRRLESADEVSHVWLRKLVGLQLYDHVDVALM